MSAAFVQLNTLLRAAQVRFEGRNDRGATAVEYGLLVGLIAIVIIAGVTLLGNNLLALFNNIAGQVKVV